MMRVTTLYAASAAATASYYTQYLTAAPGEQPGQWLGRQADAFGLTGRVDGAALELLLSGRHPVDGSVLGRPLVDRVRADGSVTRAVAGFDATLSAPKSVSVWWALTGDDRIAQCHDVAVRAVADHLERYGATTRIRAGDGRLHPDTDGLTMAAFRQTTSRLDDPQLHTHLVVSAKVRVADGRWYALDARYLKRHQRALGGLYQSVLRAELTHRFGVAFGPIVNGQAEIAGVPDELLAVFSKRTGVDRRRDRRPRRRVRAARGPGPDPLRACRHPTRSRRRHPHPQVRQRPERPAHPVARRSRRRRRHSRRARRRSIRRAAADRAAHGADRHRRRGPRHAGGAVLGVAPSRRPAHHLRHRPPRQSSVRRSDGRS